MSRRGWIEVLRAGTALGLLVAASAQAYAGGFRRQGTEHLRAGQFFRRHSRGWLGVVDVLESGDHDAIRRHPD